MNLRRGVTVPLETTVQEEGSVGEDVVTEPDAHDSATIHNRDSVAELLDERQVMSRDDHG